MRTPEDTVEAVLRAAELVPAGRVVAYGDLAELVGTTPRRVGTVMSRHGSAVPWWRVTNRAGELPAPLLPEARRHWAQEGIATTDRGCRIAAHRADLVRLADAFEAAG